MRVLSLNPGLTELIFSIGGADMLVGRTEECRFPAGAQKIPSIGPMIEVSEVLVDIFEPDLVLTGPGQITLTEELGKKYKVVYFDPQSFEDMFVGIEELGKLLGKQVEAEMLLHEMQTVIDKIKEQSGRFQVVRTYVEVDHRPPHAAEGYIAELVRYAGGSCYTGEVTVENIQEFDPQYIISCVPSEDEFNFDMLTSRDGWGRLNAVKYERLFSIPCVQLHHPGPRLVEGMKHIAKVLHGIGV